MIKEQIQQILQSITGLDTISLSVPPNQDMGDLAFACFELSKKEGKNPAAVAADLVSHIDLAKYDLLKDVKAFGPYVNFFIHDHALVQSVFEEISRQRDQYGTHDIGKGKTYMIEYGCPNPMKAFHLGHLKNLITGESVVRVFENAGYTVQRVNYQGDVGMHIGKALWGIYDWKDQFDVMHEKSLTERVEFLGKAYAHGAQHFESGEEGKQEVIAYNDKVYERDPSIQAVYQTARQWSLDYFDTIYQRLGTHFDQFYFESEMFERGVEIVKEWQEKGVFAASEGAVIFPGSAYGLHDRVFLNSKGFPTYEAKELALSEARFIAHDPDKIIHVVGKEQTQYFQVIFKALEQMWPETAGREYHLPGGFLQLKGEQKMSSRKGNIITGDALIAQVEDRIRAVMAESDVPKKEETIQTVAVAALKYAMLKADITKDVAFDMEESISTSGDSGPYLLYIVARITRMLEKVGEWSMTTVPTQIHVSEKSLVTLLGEYPVITHAAVEALDPSKISRYLFDLAKAFNSFYDACPVLDADSEIKGFRLALIFHTQTIMTHGLFLLGIETVDQM